MKRWWLILINAHLQVVPRGFEKGHRGVWRVEDLFARYAAPLSDNPAEQAQVRAKAMPVTWLDNDWSLNALGR